MLVVVMVLLMLVMLVVMKRRVLLSQLAMHVTSAVGCAERQGVS